MTRFGEAAGGGRPGKATALLATSLLFGFGHFYKGPAGVVQSTASGLVLGGVYLLTGNLWPAILAHGLGDTFAILALYYGWFS
jgi:membrane protease YdiL (CAAX protease family)